MKKFLYICLITIMCLFASNVYAANTFYDTRGTKYEGVVERMAALEIVNGMTNTTYAPNKKVTRAELAKIVVKMKGIENYASSVEYKNVFSDVKKDDWFAPYVMIARDLELVNGYEDGTFRPNQDVTYAELIVILLRNLGYTNIKQETNGEWYKNYIIKMRNIELNDTVGEFDYSKPAIRGDVAMFVWNALVTNRWSEIKENETSGITYTYSEKTPLETYFTEYNFLNKETVTGLGGKDGKIAIYTSKGVFTTEEKVPLYVLGGSVTGLYEDGTDELIGVSFDEKYQNTKVVSGPTFYLKEKGYNLSRSKKTVSYGSSSNSNYAYLVLNENGEILRTVYVDASNSSIVNSISVTEESGDSDEKIQKIKLNDDEFDSTSSVLVRNSQSTSWKNLSKDEVVTNLGRGLYIKEAKSFTGTITAVDDKNEIWVDEEKYIVANSGVYYRYNDKDASGFGTISLKGLREYEGVQATIYLNVAEEICKIEFRKTQRENDRYQIGYVTKIKENSDESKKTIEVLVGDGNIKKAKITESGRENLMIGDLVGIGYDDDDNMKCVIITRDTTFDNDIAVKYDYKLKEIEEPLIGEYLLNSDTEIYKVILRYKNNSKTQIEKCEIKRLQLDDMNDLLSYQINLIYDEDMIIRKIYAVSETNKYENQIALVKEKRIIRESEDKHTYRVTLSVTGNAVSAFDVGKEEYSNFVSGDIVTYVVDEKDSKKITLDEVFKKESIGYKRDLIVESFDKTNKKIELSDGTTLDLNQDLYMWNNKKINLNTYRFIKAKVAKTDDGWRFHSLAISNKEDVTVEKGDRLAIGELNKTIIIYSGYEE